MRSYFVYILASKTKGTLYVGVTNDLVRRVAEHREGGIDGFTKTHDIKRLVYYETAEDVMVAMEHEKRLKRWNREWKFRIIEEMNPTWKDLYLDIC